MKEQINIKGLSDEEVLRSRQQHGSNTVVHKKENRFLRFLKDLASEPMVILLFIASLIYFITGSRGEGIFMASAILMVAGISLYQDSRTRLALSRLKELTQPNCRVVRNGSIQDIRSEELVIGDCLIAGEGTLIAADGLIIQANDFSVNESILTGESFTISKDVNSEDNNIYQGTTVTSGLAVARITAIGESTRWGKIGKSLEQITDEKTPLEISIASFVRKMVVLGVIVFLIVWAINYFKTYQLLDSLLKALTLAMSILPEEIPVAFTTFLALGAWRLMKMGILVKKMKTVETLGMATVICVDKTGTITENRMTLANIITMPAGEIMDMDAAFAEEQCHLLEVAMWASEPIPFDPMETAIHEAYARKTNRDLRKEYRMVHEYPLGGKPPMMTHVFEGGGGRRIIAAKGAPEAILSLVTLREDERSRIEESIRELAAKGQRVLAVAEGSNPIGDYPRDQRDIPFTLLGMVAFYDPPKENIGEVLDAFYTAGIDVKIVTGDNAITTAAIAREIGLKGYDRSIGGDELMHVEDAALNEQVKENHIFSRMFPEAKMRIIDALKENGEIVAMTGDGVNDAPALKAAHIGISMGKRGTEIAKQSAELVLVNDDLSRMVDAIAMGRRIYSNLKKAIQYIISIHIPIILTVFIPLALGWIYPNIFSPVHVIFLELIMGPTCSIIYENEPMEKDAMQQPPRPFSRTFFNLKELTTSIIQGLAITAGTLFAYQYAVREGHAEDLTRTMVFTTLIAANIFLTLVNRSFNHSILITARYRNHLIPIIIGITITLTALLIYIPGPAKFFGFEALTAKHLIVSIITGFVSVIWYEGVKHLGTIN